MRRLSLAIALISISACSVGPDIEGSLTLGLMPGTDSNATTDPTTGASEGSADGASSDDAPDPPTCSDGAQGEDETDVDCGGGHGASRERM